MTEMAPLQVGLVWQRVGSQLVWQPRDDIQPARRMAIKIAHHRLIISRIALRAQLPDDIPTAADVAKTLGSAAVRMVPVVVVCSCWIRLVADRVTGVGARCERTPGASLAALSPAPATQLLGPGT